MKRGKMGASKYKSSSKTNLMIILVLLAPIFFAINSSEVIAGWGWCMPPWSCTDNDYTPKGFLDAADCSNIAGWACDEDKYDTSLSVTFYATEISTGGSCDDDEECDAGETQVSCPGDCGSPPAAPAIPGRWANAIRVGLPCGSTYNHGFSFPTPAGFQNGKTYTVTATVNDIDEDGTTKGSGFIGSKTLGPCGSAQATCGDNRKEGSEECDGTDLGSSPPTCTPQSALKCYPVTDAARKCKYDTSGCAGGGLALSKYTTTIAVGGTDTITISGGTSPYSFKTNPDGQIASTTATITGSTFTITGVRNGTTGLDVKDSASNEKHLDILVGNGTNGTIGLCSYRGPYDPGFPVSNPPVTLKEKVGRAMMCKEPDDSSMDYVVEQANLLGANIRRHCCKPGGSEPRDDTIDLPDGTIIDLIYCVNPTPTDGCTSRWQWIEPGGGIPCSPDYRGQMEGFDLSRITEDTRYSSKYGAAWYMQCTDPASSGAMQSVYNRIISDGISGGVSLYPNGDMNLDGTGDGYIGIRDRASQKVWRWAYYCCWMDPTCTHPAPRNEEGVCTGGNCNNNTICDPGENSTSCPSDCNLLPHIDSVTNPVRVGEIFTIRGQRLTPTVQYFDSARVRSTYTGTMNTAATQVTVSVPSDFRPGQYTVRIYAAADRVSNEVPVTVTGGTQKCSPDGAACGFCPQDSQCLLDPLAATDRQCINSGQFSNDNYCDSGQWTTRTKLLALKLLKLKSADYVLFCDKKENSLNALQYLTASNQDASTALNNFDPNNFCVLKNSNAVIGAVSLNRNLSTNSGSINVFGAPNCDSAMAFNDNQYHPCSLNNVWYNKGLNSIIFSSAALSISSDQEQTSFIVSIIQSIIDSIKRLVVRPPYDESYLNGIKKFRRLYMSTQGSKSIMGSMDFSGQQYLNAVIRYQGFNDNICHFVDSYSITNTDASSGIACRQEGNNFYVLVQGSQYTKLNPDNIWTDLTSKLRIK